MKRKLKIPSGWSKLLKRVIINRGDKFDSIEGTWERTKMVNGLWKVGDKGIEDNTYIRKNTK
jgi:hypothetical protein